MTTKEEVLQYITTLGAQHVVTQDELLAAYRTGSGVPIDHAMIKKLGVAEILYYIGGAIVFLGIAILLAQNWSNLGFATKLLATLGAGLAAYVVGLLFSRDEKTEAAGMAFYLISALVTPIGLYVVFDYAGFDAGSAGWQSVSSGLVFSMYALSYVILRKNIFTLFSILFATWFFFSFTSFLVGSNPYFDMKFFEYRVLLIGLTYILLGQAFSKNIRAPLSGFLYGFGILGFLGAALALGGWEPEQNVFWELVFPGLVFAALFLSIHLKSKSFLTFGTLFLMVYILKITAEYFSTGLGWPLALVIAGLSLIGVGYASLYIKRKYIPS